MAKNFQKSEVKKAIVNSGGYMTQVAKKLACDWHTAKKYIEKYNLHDDLVAEDERLIYVVNHLSKPSKTLSFVLCLIIQNHNY